MAPAHNSTEQLVHARNLGPAVFGGGILVAFLNVVSLPVLKGSLIGGLPAIHILDTRTQSWFSLGVYFVSVGLAVLGSVTFGVLVRRARRSGRTEPSYSVFRPYIWTAFINLVLIGIVYVAFRLS